MCPHMWVMAGLRGEPAAHPPARAQVLRVRRGPGRGSSLLKYPVEGTSSERSSCRSLSLETSLTASPIRNQPAWSVSRHRPACRRPVAKGPWSTSWCTAPEPGASLNRPPSHLMSQVGTRLTSTLVDVLRSRRRGGCVTPSALCGGIGRAPSSGPGCPVRRSSCGPTGHKDPLRRQSRSLIQRS